jgi:hypothetical protein
MQILHGCSRLRGERREYRQQWNQRHGFDGVPRLAATIVSFARGETDRSGQLRYGTVCLSATPIHGAD